MNDTQKKLFDKLEAQETPNGYFVPFHFMKNVENVISQEVTKALEEQRLKVREEITNGVGFGHFSINLKQIGNERIVAINVDEILSLPSLLPTNQK